MNKKNKMEYRVGVGASSVLMVLVVLALTAVSLLAFFSARNAEVLALRNVEMTTSYYAAVARIQETIGLMDSVFVELSAKDDSISTDGLASAFSSLQIAQFQIHETDTGWRFAFVEDAGFERNIMVEGYISLSGTERFQIVRHQLVSEPVFSPAIEFQLMGV